MSQYDEARMHAIKCLPRAIESHERGDFFSIEEGFDDYDRMLPRQEISSEDLLFITLEFWASWSDTAVHSWKFYPGFGQADWPNLARILLEDLKENRSVTDKRLLDHFVYRPQPSKCSIPKMIKGLFSR